MNINYDIYLENVKLLKASRERIINIAFKDENITLICNKEMENGTIYIAANSDTGILVVNLWIGNDINTELPSWILARVNAIIELYKVTRL